MPAYKVPCPRCASFIMRDVAVCPFCQTTDPFAPLRCASCRAVIEDPRWNACPQCGTPVPKPGASAADAAGGPGAGPGAPKGTAPAAQARSAPGTVPGQPAAPPASQAPAPSPASQEPAPSPPAAAKACTGCGAPLAAGARFCTVCGTLAG